MGIRYIVLVVALALLSAGCGGGQEQSGEEAGGDDSGGQYEGGEPTAPADSAPAGTGFSEEACLQEASESGEAGVEVEDPREVPSYEVVGESETDTGREFEVVTEAASRDELKTVAEDLRFENRELDAIAIDFYDEGDGGRQDAGLALAFNTREAACRAFQYPVEEQDELVSESNGISVVSVEEGV